MKLPREAVLRADLTALLERCGEPADEAALDVLLVHLRLLSRWNPRFKLTGLTRWPEVLDRHLRESMLPLRWIESRGRLLDIGSGNGFPGIPILACRPGIEGVLVERSERKSLFLDAVLREAGRTNARVVTRDLGRRDRHSDEEPFDYVLGRATLPPAEYLEVASSWTRPGARIFLYARADAAKLVGRDSMQHLRLVGDDAITGRRDSSLFVLET